MKQIWLLCIFCAGTTVLAAQAGNIMARTEPDTARIQENVSAFIRLAFTRASVDSVLNYCSFPFYLREIRAASVKVYSSRQQLKAELQKSFKKADYKPVLYSIKGIVMAGPRPARWIKDKRIMCVKVRLHMPGQEERADGMYTTYIFYTRKNYPYSILGIAEE